MTTFKRRVLVGVWAVAAAALCILMLVSGKARAAEAGDTWITGSALSYHTNRSVPHNETNLGIGLERYLTPDLRLGIAEVHNSFWKPSLQMYFMYTPLKLGDIKLGAAAGGVTGYGPVVAPAALAVATWETERFGLDLVAFPRIPSLDVNGFAAIRFKFKWGDK